MQSSMIASTNTDVGWLVGRIGRNAYSCVSNLGVHASGGVLPPGATTECSNTVVPQAPPVMQTREGRRAGGELWGHSHAWLIATQPTTIHLATPRSMRGRMSPGLHGSWHNWCDGCHACPSV